ncbi:MAG: GNAT family N-acetyltransferase [Planctomycetota bacterium]
MKTVEVRVIAYGSEEYICARELRERVLRKPLGLTMRPEDTDGEDTQLHFSAFEGNRVVGCLIAVVAFADSENGASSARLRQIAVDEPSQRSGVGTQMMEFAEGELSARGVTDIWLQARADATRFYSKLGYVPEGAGFQELGIPHQKMVKRIEPFSD